jgi:hypothetical protein
VLMTIRSKTSNINVSNTRISINNGRVWRVPVCSLAVYNELYKCRKPTIDELLNTYKHRWACTELIAPRITNMLLSGLFGSWSYMSSLGLQASKGEWHCVDVLFQLWKSVCNCYSPNSDMCLCATAKARQILSGQCKQTDEASMSSVRGMGQTAKYSPGHTQSCGWAFAIVKHRMLTTGPSNAE